MAAEDKEGLQKQENGEEEIDFGTGQNKGDDTIADGAEDGAGFDGEIKFGRGGGTDGDAFLWVLNW